MAKQTINIGTSANDGTGSTLREAFDITNDNFTELYDGTGGLLYKLEGTNFTGSLLIGHSNTGTLSSAQFNTGVGIGALDALTTGDMNVALGYAAGSNINTGTENVALGSGAFQTATDSSRNIAIGRRALSVQNVSGNAYNIAVGHDAGRNVTTGTQNTIIGSLAADALTTSVHSVAIGYKALSTEDTGHYSVAIGSGALEDQNYDGSAFNVAVGYEAGNAISTGVQNTIMGGAAADSLTTGSNNIVLGYNAEPSAVDVSNEVTIGDSNISTVRIPSDSTLKIGASGDLQLEHLSSNSFIKNTAVGDLYIENQVNDKDVIFRSDDGSGGLSTYFFLDGSSSKTVFPDNKQIQIGGGGGDGYIYSDGTNMWIQGNNPSADMKLYQGGTDGSIRFYSDNGSGGVAEYFAVDGGEEQVRFFKNTEHQDGVYAYFGGASDLGIVHSGADSLIINETGDLYIRNKADDKDIIFQSDNGSGGTETYFQLDGSHSKMIAYKDVHFEDNIKVRFGNYATADLEIYHNSSNDRGYIYNTTGDLYIENDATDGDIKFFSDDGSGGTTEYFRVDGGSGKIIYSKNQWLYDNIRAVFGSSDDLQIFHNGTSSYIENTEGNIVIVNYANDKDIQLYSDDGSGGTTEYFRVDGSSEINIFSKSVRLNDSVQLQIGAGQDLKMYHNGTDSFIINETGNLKITQGANDKDIIFESDNGSGGTIEYFKLDGSRADTNYTYTTRPDGGVATFGDSLDLRIWRDPLVDDSYIRNYNDDFFIETHATDGDIVFKSDDGSGGVTEYFKLDGGSTLNIFYKPVFVGDGVKFLYGNSSDLQIYHDGSHSIIKADGTGNLILRQDTADADIVFKSDDGSGGSAEYFRVDGGLGYMVASKHILLDDNVKLRVGSSADLEIFHDGSNSYIKDSGTGNLSIQGTQVDILNPDGNEYKARFLTDGAAELYYDSAKKLETKSTGIEVTGSVKADGNVALGNISGVARLQHEGSGQLKMLSSGDSTIATFTSTGSTFPSDIETTSSSKGLILKSPDGTRYRVTVANGGTLSVSAV